MTAEVEPIYAKLGTKIRKMRELFGFKQVEFSALIGISRPSLVNIELGRQRIAIHDITAICKALKIDPSVLMKGIWK